MNRLQEIIIGSKERSKEIGKWEKQGLLRKIAPRVYTSRLEDPSEKIIHRNWYRLVSDLFPDALLSHRSALERRPTPDGHLYLARSYKGLVELPGPMLHFSKGPAPLKDDTLFLAILNHPDFHEPTWKIFSDQKGRGKNRKH